MVTQCMVGAVKRGHSATTMERRLQEQATKQTKTMSSHLSRLFNVHYLSSLRGALIVHSMFDCPFILCEHITIFVVSF